MQYNIINTDLMIKGKLYNENSTIELDTLPEGLEQFLVPVNNQINEVSLIQETVQIPAEDSEQKIEIVTNKKNKRGRKC